jgi:alanyl-tRNA synthetase
MGKVESGSFKVGDVIELRVDAERRGRLRRAHSATHLLHAALRHYLGDHVAQRGSLVAPDRLRFDFSHTRAMSAGEIVEVEDEVNAFVRQNDDVTTRVMGLEDARAAGAMALFGEKYGDEVRVVSMGENPDGGIYSLELCGGTHVERTGDIALVKLVGDSAVASGIRRVDALTGSAAVAYVREQEQLLHEAAAAIKATPKELPARIQQMVEERRQLESQLADARKKLASGGTAAEGPKTVNGVSYVGRALADLPAKELRSAVDDIKKQIGSGVIALVAVNDGKAAMVVAVTDDLKDRFNAVDLLRRGVEALGGKGGGGRPDFAQGGGPDGDAADTALAAVEQAIAA